MKEFSKQIQRNFKLMLETGKLFRSSVSGNDVWNTYLNNFNEDPVFRDPQSSVHNCNSCKSFVRRYGNVVAINADYEIITLFDNISIEEYSSTCNTLSYTLTHAPIGDVFFETVASLDKLSGGECNPKNKLHQLGTASNIKVYTAEEADKFGVVNAQETRVFTHMHIHLPNEYIDDSGASVEAIIATYRDAKNVFQRAMVEIPLDTYKVIRDLVAQGSLLNGETHIGKIGVMLSEKQEYDNLPANKRDNWCWKTSYKNPFAKFKNELIGVLCTELAEGEDINTACRAWNIRVDPVNYMKATAPITTRQIEEARKFVEENGYEESFDRRLATIDDINVSEILHSNVGDGTVKNASIFDGVKASNTSKHKRNQFDEVEEVSIETFMSEILPTCSSIEAFLENAHEGNMVTITTANKPDSKPIFKWGNNYSWTFNGNLAGKSEIKQAVKDRGGNITGILRFSIIWNEGDGKDNSDLDAWCRQPNGQQIGFNTGFRKDNGNNFSNCGGQLDIDITAPSGRVAVENIYFPKLRGMQDGVYKFWVNQYSARNSQGFRAEIEIDGDIYTYEYPRAVSGNIQIAEVTLEHGKFSIKHLLPEQHSSKEIYGLATGQFHKVNLVCLSPNHWGENNVGNKHYFFMLNGCVTDTPVRGFHNENLKADLMDHRKVMEVLGNTSMIAPKDKQLSGLGFNATVKDSLIVKLQGSFKRVVKIKF